MRDFLVAGNWKMHKTVAEAQSFVELFLSGLTLTPGRRIAIFPSSVTLASLIERLKGTPVGVGAQNCHFERQGAFTGETSAWQLKELGCTQVLIGHSERGSLFNETDADLAKKMKAAQEAGLSPMLCLGETLQEREKNQTAQVIRRQLTAGLSLLNLKANSPGFTIAYEPVWAIGTGKVATPEMAEEAHAVLRSALAELGGQSLAESTLILYGGSVKPDNATALAKQPNIDGFLVGGAALEAASFQKLAMVAR